MELGKIRNITLVAVDKDGRIMTLDYDATKYDSETELFNDLVVDVTGLASKKWEEKKSERKTKSRA